LSPADPRGAAPGARRLRRRLAAGGRGQPSDEELETLLKLTERYCVVYQTLAAGVPVSLSHGVSR